MTKGNKLTRPFGGPQMQKSILVGGIPTGFVWNFNPDTRQFEVVKAMPDGTDDVVEFSSPLKSDAEVALRDAIERDFPGLMRQHGVRNLV